MSSRYVLTAANIRRISSWVNGRVGQSVIFGDFSSFAGLSATHFRFCANSKKDRRRYFERNAARMRYPKFRKQGLFVGSGVIEAGCKTIIATRLKRSGMFWTVRGANAVIAGATLTRRFGPPWKR